MFPSAKRGRALMLCSTVLMVSFYAVVVLSVSLTLSQAIRASEKSAAKNTSSPSSNHARPLFKSWLAMRVRPIFGADGCNHGRVGCGGRDGVGELPTARPPKTGGDYTQTKRLLRKLTVGSVAVMATVMAAVVSSLRKGTIAHVSIAVPFCCPWMGNSVLVCREYSSRLIFLQMPGTEKC